MIYFVRFAQISAAIILLAVVLLVALLRLKRKKITYRYALASTFKRESLGSAHPHKKVFWLMRFFTLVVLALLIAKPQLVDSRSNVQVDGIDIVLVLDASGSMTLTDLEGDDRQRFEIAKQEAIRFAQKRDNDAIGLVIFANDAVSRCPITSDKKIICNMIRELQIGEINPDGTVLAQSVVTAANRLKHSKAKSKVMILLTDGEPSQHDMNPDLAIQIAQKLGIKVYTIGIGSDKDSFMLHPFFGRVPKPKVNAPLLTQIAQQTGGQFFMAYDAADMRKVYETIDQLERTKHETPVFSNYYDLFVPVTLGLMGCMSIEMLLSTFMWFTL